MATQNMTLALEALAPYGCILPTEATAALETAFPLKRVEAGVKNLQLFGRIDTVNGKPYYIAEGQKVHVFGPTRICYFLSRQLQTIELSVNA